MPETTFAVRWPDGAEQRWYSPSLVVHELLEPGATYEVGELVRRAREAMTTASERVRASYGFPCSRALGSLQDVEAQAARYATDERATVLT